MFGTIARMMLEANGAAPRPPRRAGGEEVVCTADGWVTRPRPQRVTQWSDALGAFETFDAVWNETTQTFDRVDVTCTAPGVSRRVASTGGWSPADEAQVLARDSPRKPA